MLHRTFGITCLLVALCLPALAQPPASTLSLRDDWRLQSGGGVSAGGEAVSAVGFDDHAWYKTTVPRTVLAALVDNGVYPDPYYGLNMTKIPGFSKDLILAMAEDSPFRGPWWYRVEFDVPGNQAGGCATLHLDGINYRAEVWLNGTRVADETAVVGMFRRFGFDVGKLLRYGERNALAVRVTGPGQGEVKDYGTKQIEATTGWDDHNPWPPDLNTGIWQNVSIRFHGPVTIAHAYVESDLDLPALDTARLTVSAHLTNHGPAQAQVTFRAAIDAVKLEQAVALQPGETREVILTPEAFPQLVFAKPRLWWPAPLGLPEMYKMQSDAEVNGAVSDTAWTFFGIREITTSINEENWRQYEVNGRPVLIRGGAWMTSDMLLRLSPERYDALVRYARDAGFNMLRSEGFSIRETDDFYNACDRLGIMVAQQIFGRSLPDEPLALACAEDMMLRIRSHPSLVHFLGHDETYPTEALDQGYKELIARHRVDRTYQPHSGTFFVPERVSTGGTRTGTRELWTYASPEHYYRRTFDGAWGFAQSGGIGGIVAPRDSIDEMLPEDQRWPALDTEGWSLHSVIQGNAYFDAFRKAMDTCYGAPADLDDFCRKAYAMNYNSARGMFEAYGRNKYKATGITTWKYDAAWPAAITWQYIDWYLRPTAAYYGAKKACEPLHVQFAYDDRGVWVINSYRAAIGDLKVSATLYNFSLEPVFTQEAKVSVPEDGSVCAFNIPGPEGLSETHFLRLELHNADGSPVSENFYWLSTTPDIPGKSGENLKGLFWTAPKSSAQLRKLNELAPASVTAEEQWEHTDDTWTGRISVKNTGSTLAFFVRFDVLNATTNLAVAPTYWSDNCISLLPGATRELTVQIPAPARDTGAPLLRISGWNVAPEPHK